MWKRERPHSCLPRHDAGRAKPAPRCTPPPGTLATLAPAGTLSRLPPPLRSGAALPLVAPALTRPRRPVLLRVTSPAESAAPPGRPVLGTRLWRSPGVLGV